MNIRVLDPSTRRVTAWSGGKTTELFLYPFDGSYAERRFNIRISSATVDLPESRFTRLDGVTRYLTPLSEGFYLKRGGRWIYLPHGDVLCFSGEEDILCRGSGRDLKRSRADAAYVSVPLLSGGNERQRHGASRRQLCGDHLRGVLDASAFPPRRSVQRRYIKKLP